MRTAARAIGLRLALWGGLGLPALLLVGDFGSLLRCASNRGASTEEPASSAVGLGWPHHRGSHYNSRSDETDLADVWPASGPRLLWSARTGRGYSAVVAVGDRVSTQAQTLSGQSVICLDADTGATVWERRYGWPYEAAGMYPGPRATPTWHAGPDGPAARPCGPPATSRPVTVRRVQVLGADYRQGVVVHGADRPGLGDRGRREAVSVERFRRSPLGPRQPEGCSASAAGLGG